MADISVSGNGCECGAMQVDACTALKEVAAIVCEQGTTVVYIKRGESDIKRDSLHAIDARSLTTRYKFKAYPVERQPNRKTLERAGIKEDVDTIVFIPLAMFVEAGLIRTPVDEEASTLGEDFSKIEMIRSTVILDGSEWKIRDKGLSGRIAGIPIYVTFGLQQQ